MNPFCHLAAAFTPSSLLLAVLVIFACAFLLPVLILNLARGQRHRRGILAANIAEGTREFASLIPDAAVPTRFLLVKRGSDAAHFALAGPGDRAIGVCEDQTATSGMPTPGLPLRVSRLGISTATKKVAVSGPIAVDDLLVPAAGGFAQKLPVGAGTYWVIGAADKAGAAGDVVEFIACLPYKVTI